MTRMKRGNTNHRPLTTRSAFLSAAFARATAGGLRSAVLVVPTLFPSLSFVKIFLPDEGVASTGYGKPASSPRRIRVAAATRTRNARATLRWLEKARRRFHGAAQIEPACLLPGVSDHRQTSP